jgi:hypothetical protein
MDDPYLNLATRLRDMTDRAHAAKPWVAVSAAKSVSARRADSSAGREG